MTPHEFLTKLMMLACRFPYRITSFYRDPLSNARVGGKPHSRHMFWTAADVILWNTGDKLLFMEEGRRLGLTVTDEGDHLHIQEPKP